MFKNLNSHEDFLQLDSYLTEKSYLSGYSPTLVDTEVFRILKTCPPSEKYPNAARWYRHISSYGNEKHSFEKSNDDLSKFVIISQNIEVRRLN